MAKVTSVDCGEGQDCGEVIEIEARLRGVMTTEDAVQLHLSVDTPNLHDQYGAIQFSLTHKETWNLELEPGDIYDVIFVRRDTAGDNVSGQ